MEQATIYPGQYILLDANVLQHAVSKVRTKVDAVGDCLQQFTLDGYQLAVSEYTVFENLHGLWGKKLREATQFLGSFQRIEVSGPILNLAALLGGLYHDEGVDSVNAGDKLIAATAILENGLVLTGNHKDFLPPFFHTQQSLPLAYQKQHYIQHLDLALYTPNIDLIGRRIVEKNREV